ncbi:MAG: hypothetical protein ABSH32_21620 [Bryobacteraceae bacterium]|jgi:hypothetical protein
MEVKYANIMGFRVSRNELVLEFGNFFAGQDDNRTKPDYRDFHTRVVLPAELIEALKQSLEQASGVRDQAKQAVEGQPKFKIETKEVKLA